MPLIEADWRAKNKFGSAFSPGAGVQPALSSKSAGVQRRVFWAQPEIMSFRRQHLAQATPALLGVQLVQQLAQSAQGGALDPCGAGAGSRVGPIRHLFEQTAHELDPLREVL